MISSLPAPAIRVWKDGTLQCFVTPSTEAAPYAVVICEGLVPLSRDTFTDHAAALAHARATLAQRHG